MNKILAILLMFALSSVASYAQSHRGRTPFFRGERGGYSYDINQVNIMINRNNEYHDKIGFGFAIHHVEQVRKHAIHFRGFEYMNAKEYNGFVFPDDRKMAFKDASYELHSIYMPFGYRLFIGHGPRLYVSASIGFDLAIHSKIKAQKISSLDPDFNAYMANDDEVTTEQIDYSFSVPFFCLAGSWGAGISIPIGYRELVFEVNRFLSMRNYSGAHYDDVRLNQWRFTLGYCWDF